MKKLSYWSAYYFTHPRSWYPLPEGAIQFKDVPLLKPLPARELSQQNCQRLINFSNIYGRAVRQRSGRQETTKSKAGTLPPSCYKKNVPIHKVMLRPRLRDDASINADDEEHTQHSASTSVDIDISEDDDSNEFDSDESYDLDDETSGNGFEDTLTDAPQNGKFIQ